MKKGLVWLILVMVALVAGLLTFPGGANAAHGTHVSTCQILNSAGTTYGLPQNITSGSTCFTIEAYNITLDGGGFTVTMTGTGDGVLLSHVSGVTVENFTVVGGTAGINL